MCVWRGEGGESKGEVGRVDRGGGASEGSVTFDF